MDSKMDDIWSRFDEQFKKIGDTFDELNSGVSEADIESAEKELGLLLPKDLKDSYLIHNGQKGILFLLGWRLWPLEEILKNAQQRRKENKKSLKVYDSSDRIKDCVNNNLWISFADNGGNGMLAIDLDPGDKGVIGQVIALYEDGTELVADSYREFMEATLRDIESGKLQWDVDGGGFIENDDNDKYEDQNYKHHKIIQEVKDESPTYDDLKQLQHGDEIVLVGSMKLNIGKNKHQLLLNGEIIKVHGNLAKTSIGPKSNSPLFKLKIRVGKKSLLGFGSADYEIITSERISLYPSNVNE